MALYYLQDREPLIEVYLREPTIRTGIHKRTVVMTVNKEAFPGGQHAARDFAKFHCDAFNESGGTSNDSTPLLKPEGE